MLGAIGEIIQQENETLIKKITKTQNQELTEIKIGLQKIERLLKYAIPDMENLIECPHCKEYNAPDIIYCIRCNKKILAEDKDGRKE